MPTTKPKIYSQTTHGRSMRNRSQNNRFAARLGDVLLSLLAIAGGVSIVLVILAVTMNISLMMFRTGSMEPTISTGSVAVVREIDATEMAEGDIITVDRGDDLQIGRASCRERV